MQSPINTKFNPNHVFFTSDTHFNHSNIIRFCNRPFRDVEEMNETIIRNWNSVVSPDDIVFHLTYEEHIEWFNISYPSNKVRKSDYRPYVLTPTGLLLLSLRVNSPLAIKTDIRIIRTVSSKISIFELPKQIKQQS